jgi:citronellol/citronellal dehydrogenase
VASLAGKTIYITGASRGIGHAIALRAAKDGAHIVIAAKTTEPHPKLPGTIYTAAEEIERAGGRALPTVVDVRDEAQIAASVEKAVETFGGIDILVNNASAISLTGTLSTPMKRYDLMHQINTRGTFATTQACLPYLKNGDNPHVLNLSPPLNMKPRWFKDHVAYTMAKYGMSMCVLGMAEEFRGAGIAFNALWPRTGIATAAIHMLGGDAMMKHCRRPEIMADAAHAILLREASTCTGNFFIDEDVLRAEGMTDFRDYAIDPSVEPMTDFFLD